jgi:hypothetical protein
MRDYLESEILQRHVGGFFDSEKPVAAIAMACCWPHAASRRVPAVRCSAVALENSAWSLARVTRFWDPHYYRTYLEQDGQPRGFMSVQQEVTRALARREDFRDVPSDDPDYRRKTSGLQRDTLDNPTPAFVVRDRNYVSARWPGDVHSFARTFAEMLS